MQYGLQKVMTLRGYDIITDKPAITLKFLKNLTVTNGQESTPLTQDGTPLTHFDHSASLLLEGESSVIDDGLLSLQVGKDIEVLANTTEIRISEVVEVGTDSALSTYTAKGVVGAELKYIEVLDGSDNVVEIFEQMTGTVTTKKFTYAFATKTIEFFAGDLPTKTRIRLHYYPTVASARKISKLVDKASATLRWEGEAVFKDVCTSQETLGLVLIPKGKLTAAFSWSLTEAGEPATHSFSVQAEQTCQKKLWDIYIFNESDLS